MRRECSEPNSERLTLTLYSTTMESEGSTATSVRYTTTTSQLCSYQLVSVTESEAGKNSESGVSSDTYRAAPDTSASVSCESRSARARQRQNSACNPSLPLHNGSFKYRLGFCSLRRSHVYRRFPCSKNIWLVYTMFFLQGLAEFSAVLFLFFGLDAYKTNPPKTVALYLFVRCLVFMASPVMGFLADTFFGRYYIVKASLYVCLLGAVTLAVGFSTATFDPWLKHDEVNHYHAFNFDEEEQCPTGTKVFIGIVYTVMLTGFTGVQVNLIPFGVDQLTDASSGELSSYFHWYFWWLTAGYLVSAVTVPYIYRYYSLGPVFLLLAVCFAVEIMILILYRDNGFVILPHIGNPLKLVYRVVRSALKARRPVFRSAFDVGRPPPSRLELAMQMNGGPFTVEQVEDVKTFFQILLILLSFFGYFAVSSQLSTTYVLEGVRMTIPQGTYENCTEILLSNTHFFDNFTAHSIECRLWNILPSVWIALTNFLPVLILIPLVDRLLYVSCMPKMLKRIAIGKVFLLASILVAIAVEAVRIDKLLDHFIAQNSTIVINAIPFHTKSATTFHNASPLSILWITPQYTLFAFAGVFGRITAVEFIYAQSPGAMKGLLLGMLFLTDGIAKGGAALLILLQSFPEDFHFLSFFGNSNNYVRDILTCMYDNDMKKCMDSPLFSYILLAVAVVVSALVFVRAAIKYRLRTRDVEPYNPIA